MASLPPHILATGVAVAAAGAGALWCCCAAGPVVVDADESDGIPVLSPEDATRLRLKERYDQLARLRKETEELEATADVASEAHAFEVGMMLERVLAELERIDATALTNPSTPQKDLDTIRAVRKGLVAEFKEVERRLFAVKKRTSAELV